MPDTVIFSIQSVQHAFNLVFAFALADALRHVIPFADRNEDFATFGPRQLERLPSLVTFLFLFTPFFHGLSMYFVRAYDATKLTTDYGQSLLFDFALVAIIAGIFVGLARLLALRNTLHFFYMILALFVIDIAWANTTVLRDKASDGPRVWVMINIIYIAVVAPILICIHRMIDRNYRNFNDALAKESANQPPRPEPKCENCKCENCVGTSPPTKADLYRDRVLLIAGICLCVLMIIRTYADYRFAWSYYFPVPK